MHVYKLLRVTRPRFWIYLIWPYMVWIVAAYPDMTLRSSWWVWWWACFFLIPANLYLYGINDLYDRETDHHNPKKTTYEARVEKKEYTTLLLAIGAMLLVGAWLFYAQWAVWAWKQELTYALGAFVVLWWAYSAWPLRCKTRPFLDSLSNVLYIMPWLFGYYMAWGSELGRWFVAACAWAMAMHTYSALPDIAVDKQAGITTTAVWLWQQKTVLYCAALWLLAIGAATTVIWWWARVWWVPYIWMCMRARAASPERLWQLYTWFPSINTLVGWFLFWFFLYFHLFDFITALIDRIHF